MAITLTGTGGLFTRLGVIGSALNNFNGFLATTAPTAGLWGASGQTIACLADNMNNIEAQFQAGANRDLADQLFTNRDKLRSSAATYRAYLQSLAQTVLVRMADDDVKLNSKTVALAMTAVYLQFISEADKISQANTVSVATANGRNGTPVGNGVCIASVIEPLKGLTLQYPFAETLDLLCTTDTALGASAGRETFSFQGDAAQTDPLAYDWPLGSGQTGTLTACSPSDNSGTGGVNALYNSNFETFTVANTPDKWSIDVGAAGTDVFSSGTAFAGSTSLKFLGTGGSPLSTIRQTFNSASGTTAILKPNTVYAVNCWMLKDATLTGVVKLDLVDGTNTVINDAAATANTITQDVSTLSSATWGSVSGFFRTPSQLPASGYKFQIRISTALLNTKALYIDHLTMSEARQAYTGGPWFQLCSGGTNFVAGAGGIVADSFAVTVSNNWASFWAKFLVRMFGLRDLKGLQLPTTGGGTAIADSLITAQ